MKPRNLVSACYLAMLSYAALDEKKVDSRNLSPDRFKLANKQNKEQVFPCSNFQCLAQAQVKPFITT